jgi:hypoxanthine phosphoribosyltransferase
MKKVYVKWKEIEELVDLLAQQITKSNYQFEHIFGLQRGGLIPAVLLSHKLGIPMTQDPNKQNTLIVDDICDSGLTFHELFLKYPKARFACLYFKPHTSYFNPDFSANKFFSDDWICYPWERVDSKTIQDYKL